MSMNAKDRYYFWKEWESEICKLADRLEWEMFVYFEPVLYHNDINGINIPDDFEKPIMQKLSKMANKMHELVSERLELAGKVCCAVDDEKNKLIKELDLDYERKAG